MTVEFPRADRDELDTLTGAVVATDEEGRIAYLNPSARDLLGWVNADPVGLPLSRLMPDRMHARHSAGFSRYQASGESKLLGRPVRVPALRRDGQEIEIELTLRMFRRPDGTRLVVAAMRDTTHEHPAGDDALELETRLARRAYMLI